ncbi:hypothetical protein A0H81_11589 [Grifola frondosa]|uniref:Pyridoxamine 5'-phosphate oxidase Alr4036 family FMN-binding domain-containing protein n=1 Tax=Grifola frondosa TaxID=5627 RepID=A0A1C7LUH5_GRIFR|nr:hypothetical protein A0H81_11589 [Grifola frondosa]
MASPPRWFTAITKALSLPENKGQIIYQIATVDSNNTPHVRSQVHRGIVIPDEAPYLPVMLTTTDIRTPKVVQMLSNPNVEIAWWMQGSQDQFRVSGRVHLVPHPIDAARHTLDSSRFIALAKMQTQGFDWEKKRLEVFDAMSPRMKAGWCVPPPGSVIPSYEEAKKWPTEVAKLGEAQSEEERKNQEEALRNFVLIFVEPFEVDWAQLATNPNRRTKFKLDGEKWVEELVVPARACFAALRERITSSLKLLIYVEHMAIARRQTTSIAVRCFPTFNSMSSAYTQSTIWPQRALFEGGTGSSIN